MNLKSQSLKSDTVHTKFNFPMKESKNNNNNKKPCDAKPQKQFLETIWEDDLIIRETALVRSPLGKGHFLQN